MMNNMASELMDLGETQLVTMIDQSCLKYGPAAPDCYHTHGFFKSIRQSPVPDSDFSTFLAHLS
jgi:hypothetical protein